MRNVAKATTIPYTNTFEILMEEGLDHSLIRRSTILGR